MKGTPIVKVVSRKQLFIVLQYFDCVINVTWLFKITKLQRWLCSTTSDVCLWISTHPTEQMDVVVYQVMIKLNLCSYSY